MKFLCVPCDEPMTLSRVIGPDEGSLTVVFGCPQCGRETAMLTNAMETQVVRSLGVRIGGRPEAAAPMGTVRTALVGQRDDVPAAEEDAPGHASLHEGTAASKCPFSGTVAEAFGRQEIPWTREAEARLARIPSFARAMAKQSIEQYAREKGYAQIGEAVLDEVRGGWSA
jgi:hypothetical protein